MKNHPFSNIFEPTSLTLVLLLLSLNCFTQTDTSKTKTETDSSKHSYGKAIINGRVKTMAIPGLQDSDGDGVPDQLDLEPNTPLGVQVDMHGRALDTDGDGVPDYKDKEKLTPQRCFPVDSNGVGTCPEDDCCKQVRKFFDSLTDDETCSCYTVPCKLDSMSPVIFETNSAVLTADAKAELSNVGELLRANPYCNLKVVGYNAPNYKEAQLNWDRVYTIILFFVEKEGISENRFLFMYNYGSTKNTRGLQIVNKVDLLGTKEIGENFVRPPHPAYSTLKKMKEILKGINQNN